MTPNPEITQILSSGEALALRRAHSTTTSAPASELRIEDRDTEDRDEPSLPKKGAAIVPTDVSLVAPTQLGVGLAAMQVNVADDLGDARSLRRASVVALGTAMRFDPRAAHGVLFGERMGSTVDLDGDGLIIMKEPDSIGPIG